MTHDRWVNWSCWVNGSRWIMGHVYGGSDGSWVTKSDPWSALKRTRLIRTRLIRTLLIRTLLIRTRIIRSRIIRTWIIRTRIIRTRIIRTRLIRTRLVRTNIYKNFGPYQRWNQSCLTGAVDQSSRVMKKLTGSISGPYNVFSIDITSVNQCLSRVIRITR